MSEGLRQAGVPEVKISMRTGRVVDEILSAIEEQEPGLVILGTQGAGRSEMLRVGSCAFRVSQKAPASVVLIPFGRSWELPF
jgi:nucleotide-binding universal stress UspA family protein